MLDGTDDDEEDGIEIKSSKLKSTFRNTPLIGISSVGTAHVATDAHGEQDQYSGDLLFGIV
jgi:hypothetical protein